MRAIHVGKHQWYWKSFHPSVQVDIISVARRILKWNGPRRSRRYSSSLKIYVLSGREEARIEYINSPIVFTENMIAVKVNIYIFNLVETLYLSKLCPLTELYMKGKSFFSHSFFSLAIHIYRLAGCVRNSPSAALSPSRLTCGLPPGIWMGI